MKPIDAALAGGGARALPVTRVRDGCREEVDDWVAEEVPVALEFNGISHAVMLATPLDLEDFALGFAIDEGIVDGRRDVYDVTTELSPQGITVHLDIASACFARLKDRRRSMAGRTGCGLCGTENLCQVERPLLTVHSDARFRRAAIARAVAEMHALQTLQRATGAVHAAAWCAADGEVRLLREDVGRHNALDKLVGALARADIDARPGFIAVTSRASFEMVQKTAMAGVALLAAVSAPTTYAIDLATRAGVTVAGFVRGDDLVVYTHAERVDLD